MSSLNMHTNMHTPSGAWDAEPPEMAQRRGKRVPTGA